MVSDFLQLKAIQVRAAMAPPAQERGASMVEYALLLVLVLLVAFVSVVFFGDSVVAVFDSGGKSFEPPSSGTN